MHKWVLLYERMTVDNYLLIQIWHMTFVLTIDIALCDGVVICVALSHEHFDVTVSDKAMNRQIKTSSEIMTSCLSGFFYTLRPIQSGRHFADDIFRYIFLKENAWISLKISLKFVPNVPINDSPALVEIMAWRCPGDNPLSESMMVSLLTHICVTRFQWVNNEPSHLNVLSDLSQATLKHTYLPKQFMLSMIVPMLKGKIE